MKRAAAILLTLLVSSGARGDLQIAGTRGEQAIAVARAWFRAADAGDWRDVSFSTPFFFCERTYHYQDFTAFEHVRRRLVSERDVRALLQSARVAWHDDDDRLQLQPRGDLLGRVVASELVEHCRPPPGGVRVYKTNRSYGVDYPEIVIVDQTANGPRVVAWLRANMLCDEDPC